MKQFPMKVTIRTPMHSPRMRGLQALHGPYALGTLGENLRVRINRMDAEVVATVAAELGMTKAEFCRWCAIEVAQKLYLEHMHDNVPPENGAAA